MALFGDRCESIFIRESRSVRNRHIAAVIIVDLIIFFLYGAFLYVLLRDYDVFEKVIGAALSAAIDIAAVLIMILRENRKFKSFEETVLNNEAFFEAMENQFDNAEKLFGAIYMLDDFMYVYTQNLLIPYIDIKKIGVSISSIDFIPAATFLHIYCFSGKAYSVSLRSAGEYRRKQNEFEDLLERYRQRSFAKYSGQNMYYK